MSEKGGVSEQMMNKLTVGSLFAGIGGFDLGLERTGGFEVKWQVEIDPYAQRVLAKHWPHVQRYGDIRTVTDVERVDVLCGGFPCQDISNAGRRAGIDGERSGLWSEYVRLICELRPRYVIVENVAALLESGMGRVLRDLADCGFDAEWQSIRACEFNHAHTRRRLFIVAYANSKRRERRSPEQQEISREVLPSVRNAPERRRPIELPTPVFCRGIDGIPDRTHRLRGLGNAIVPQIAEWIGNRILDYYPRNSP